MSENSDIIIWKQRAAKYWTHFRETDFPDAKPTTYEQNQKLREAFKDRYKGSGSNVLNNLVISEKLNGGDHPDPNKHFPGLTYSLPLGIYFMRRSLGEDADEAYKTFMHDVHAYKHMNGGKQERVPTLKHVEELCRDSFNSIKRMDLVMETLDWATLPHKMAASAMVGITQTWGNMFGFRLKKSEDDPDDPDYSNDDDKLSM